MSVGLDREDGLPSGVPITVWETGVVDPLRDGHCLTRTLEGTGGKVVVDKGSSFAVPVRDAP